MGIQFREICAIGNLGFSLINVGKQWTVIYHKSITENVPSRKQLQAQKSFSNHLKILTTLKVAPKSF